MTTGVFLVAEIGQAHDGSLGILHSYVDALAPTGVDAVKFQAHIAAAESSDREAFRTPFSYVDATRFDYWKRMELTRAQWLEVKKHCEDVGLEFLASPFSIAAVDMLESLDVARFKVASGEVTNLLMIDRIAQTGKPVILSSGMSSYEELDAAVAVIAAAGNDVTVMQCTTSYPTPPERLGLNVLGELRHRYPSARVGLSDHSGTIAAGIAAVALGAQALEFHAVFDRRMFGPDAAASLSIDEIGQLVDGVRLVEAALRNPVDKSDTAPYAELADMFGKALAVNADLPAGHELRIADLESKKPASAGIPAAEYRRVIGRRLAAPKARYEFLTPADLAE